VIRLPVFLILLFAVEACSGSPRNSAPTAPSPVQAAIPTSYTPAAITVSQQITFGRELTDTFIGNPLIYALSAPSDGTLIVRLDWDPSKGSDDIAHLMLIMGECAVPPGRGYPSCPNAQETRGPDPLWSALVIARMTVSAGQTYRVIVDEGLAPWDYGFNQPFTLIAAIE
jgi:hypothetical protein